ncbi:Clp protease N-terminal domain-containing protein [Streptomyces sp. NPDC048521]|uniref:Clp protease N-terminal domain-containing protein n=1 Tax=Streptomyces sp. NPDC048521 TaxID=3365566 RepID=UPI00371ABF0A
MQPRTARRAARDEATAHMDDDAGLGAEPAAVVAGARRRAVRDGDRQVDTAHLLHSLLEHDPEVRAAVGDPARLARLLGYLVQRSIGYGLRWQGSVEHSGVIPVVPVAPQAAPAVRTAPAAQVTAALPAARGGEARGGADWSPVAAAALAEARGRARRRGESRVTGTDLLAALLTDPQSRAVEVLERAGIPARDLPARIEAGAGESIDDGASC